MSTSPTAKPSRLTREQIAKANLLFLEHGSMKRKVYVFNPGWSDERIRDEVRPDFSVRSFTLRRRHHFGETREERRAKAPTAKPQKSLLAAIAMLQAKVAELESRIEKMEGDVFWPAPVAAMDAA